MNTFHNKEINDIYKMYNSSINGLTDKQVEENRKLYGKNVIKEKEKKSTARIFLDQFQDMLVIILIISAIISIFLNEIESTLVIFVVITINAILGTYQYQKAEKSLNSLRNLSSPISYVVRNNKIVKIRSYELVCGDIVIINTGDVISADGRIIEEDECEINESSLTGEAIPVKKNKKTIYKKILQVSDQHNILFSGTFCTKGKAKYIVCNVGMNTEIGEIAKKLNEISSNKTPLQNNMDSFSKTLAIIIILVCFVVLIINLYRSGNFFDSLMFAVALAVAAIPEALSTIVTIVLAIGTEKMAKENAIIKDLKSVESLGAISVICTDKTGTLTTNQMVVKDVVNYCDLDSFKRNVFLSTNYDEFLATNSPTEIALIEYSKNDSFKNYNFIKELTFTSDRKMMSKLYKINNKNIIYSKGAIDIILDKCCNIYDGNVKPLDDFLKNEILNKVDTYAKLGRRIIGFAFKEIYKNNINEKDELNMNFVGFVSIIDPPRKESYESVRKCISAGIKPIMLTGDYKNTAVSIAKDIGIYNDNDIVLTGNELEKLSQNEFEQIIDKVTVYARLNPKQKIRIVEAWQTKDKVVAMTGDGVNDALALAKADVSIAMGNGTEVAKDASSMILVDNNFKTIVRSVSNGRKIFINIRNAISFLISGNFAAIIIVLINSILNLPVPFLAVHLLFINLLTDSLPAIAIGMQDSDNDLLNRPPRNKNKSILNKKIIGNILLEGMMIFICCFLGFLKGLRINVETARTMAFSILCISRLFHSLNCSTEESFLKLKKFNKYLIISLLVGLILINSVLFIPSLKNLFVISDLSINIIFSIYSYSLIPTLIIQMFKLFK